MSVLNGLTVIKTFVEGLIADAFVPVDDGLGEVVVVAGTRAADLQLPVVADGGAVVVSEILVNNDDDPLFFEVTPYSVWNLDYRAGANAGNGAGTYLFASLRLQTQGGATIAESMKICGAVLPDGHNISFWFQDSYVYTNNTADSVFLTLSFPHTGNSLVFDMYGTYPRIVGTKLYNIPN
jgi:hypothetical protein